MLKDLCTTHYFVCYATDSQWHSQNSKNYIIDSPLYQALPPCFQICPSNMWHFLCWSRAQTRLSFPCWRWVHWAGSRDQTCARCRWTTWSGWGLWACSTAGYDRWTSARGRSPSGPWPTSACTACPPTNKSKAAFTHCCPERISPTFSRRCATPLFLSDFVLRVIVSELMLQRKAYLFLFAERWRNFNYFGQISICMDLCKMRPHCFDVWLHRCWYVTCVASSVTSGIRIQPWGSRLNEHPILGKPRADTQKTSRLKLQSSWYNLVEHIL